MKKNIFLIFVLVMISQPNIYALDSNFDKLEESGARSAFVAASVGVGTKLGELWAVDLTARVITNVVKNDNFIFDTLIGGAIRGKTLINALPIAASRGAIIGATIAGFTAPIIFDITVYNYRSLKKTFLDLKTWIDSSPEKAPVYVGNNSDYIISVTSSLGVGVSMYISYLYIFPILKSLK